MTPSHSYTFSILSLMTYAHLHHPLIVSIMMMIIFLIAIHIFWSMFAGTNYSRGYINLMLVIQMTELFRPYIEAVIYVDILFATTQVGIRTLTPTYGHIVAT